MLVSDNAQFRADCSRDVAGTQNKEVLPMRTQRQQDLIMAAMAIAAEDGFSRLTIRNIAAKIGVTEPAVYRHFSSKIELMQAIMEDLQTAVAPYFTQFGQGEGSLKDRLSTFITGFFSALTGQPAYAPFLFSDEVFNAEPELRSTMLQIMQTNMTLLENSIKALQKQGVCRSDIPASSLGQVLMGSVRFSVSRLHLNKDPGQVGVLCRNFIETFAVLYSPQSA
jgi:AcrR family transcriptional regulator